MKIYMVSLAFAPARVMIESINQVYTTIGIDHDSFRHLVLNNHYPVNKEINDELIGMLMSCYGCTHYDLEQNVGLSAGYNYLIEQCKLEDDDIVIGIDPDVWPLTPGWGEALVKVLQADPTVGWASLNNIHSKKELQERGYTVHTIGGTVCYEGHTACVNSVCAWSGRFLKAFGGLKEQSRWYGGLEVTAFQRVKDLGFKWVYLPEFEEGWSPRVECDGCYRHYKWELAHLKTTTLDFESWLKQDITRLKLV